MLNKELDKKERSLFKSYKSIWIVWSISILVYGTLSRLIYLYYDMFSANGEILRSVSRLTIVLLLLLTVRNVIASKKIKKDTIKNPILLVSLLLFLSVPFLIGHNGSLDPIVNLTFAVTSIIVGLHEEIVFRAILQNYLLRNFGEWQSIFLTSIIFTIWHIGAIDSYISLFANVAFASLILGIIYAKTQSLFLVIFLHTLYDLISSFTGEFPIIAYSDGVIIMAISFIGVTVWGRMHRVSSTVS